MPLWLARLAKYALTRSRPITIMGISTSMFPKMEVKFHFWEHAMYYLAVYQGAMKSLYY